MSRLRHPSRHRLALAAAVLAAAAGLSACGAGAGPTQTDTRLVVSRDFGQNVLKASDQPESQGSDTVMRLLQRNAKVETRYGGGFVQSIDGLAGGTRDGRPVDWFFYVNGVLSKEGATSYDVEDGDHVWWDHHDWGEAPGSPAVVGAFPEPFGRGYDGRRRPVRIECADLESEQCDAVRNRFSSLGIVAGKGGIQRSLTKETIRVVVGTWSDIRDDGNVRRLERGPGTSGVYARPAADGRSITILDPRGRPTRTITAGAALIAAMRIDDAPPFWVVTGTDEAGLRAATSALAEAPLAQKYAFATSPATGALSVPEVAAAARQGTP